MSRTLAAAIAADHGVTQLHGTYMQRTVEGKVIGVCALSNAWLDLRRPLTDILFDHNRATTILMSLIYEQLTETFPELETVAMVAGQIEPLITATLGWPVEFLSWRTTPELSIKLISIIERLNDACHLTFAEIGQVVAAICAQAV